MAGMVNLYVKRKLRLDRLTVPQQEMYRLGQAAKTVVISRVSKAIGANDQPAPPLKQTRRKRWSKSQNKWIEYGEPTRGWAKIKIKYGLRPVRDLRGTGLMWPENRKGGKRKPRLKNVGHLLDQIMVRRVGETIVKIEEPTTRAGRIKARAHRDMLLFSPRDKQKIATLADVMLQTIKTRLIKCFEPGGGK